MNEIKKFDQYLNEEFKLVDSIVNLFKKLANTLKDSNLSKDELTNKLKNNLLDIKEYLKEQPSEINKESFDTILNNLKININEDLIEDLNLNIFFRTLRKSMKSKGNIDIKNYIEEYFNNYITTLETRINNLDSKAEKEAAKEIKSMTHEESDEDSSVVSKKIFMKEKFKLQVELLKLQEWTKKNNKKILIICEGRDAAGKGSFIKKFTEHLNPKTCRVESFGVPTEYEKENWFVRYENVLPKNGEIVLFDRSYYNRAVVEPAMGYCTEEQYKKFMTDVNIFEKDLIKKENMIIFKFWFSVTKEKQMIRFQNRMNSPLNYWKYSPNDEASLSKWNILTNFKEQMFKKTSTDIAPWVVIDSNDKRSAQLNTFRWILNNVNYSENKDSEVFKIYSEVVYTV